MKLAIRKQERMSRDVEHMSRDVASELGGGACLATCRPNLVFGPVQAEPKVAKNALHPKKHDTILWCLVREMHPRFKKMTHSHDINKQASRTLDIHT